MKFLQIKELNDKKLENENNKRLTDIEEKLKDVNILGMFKGLEGEDGDNANVFKLFNNLDNKFSEKINLIEEKMKKIEETNYKTNKDVEIVKNTFDLNNRNFEHMKESLESLENKVNSLEQTLNTKLEELNIKYDNKTNTIDRTLEEMKNKNENVIKFDNREEAIKDDKEEEKKYKKLFLENKERINELSEHLAELDKYIKSCAKKDDIEDIKTDMSALKTKIWNCPTLEDMSETKEREGELQKQISNLRELVEDLNAKQMDRDDYLSYKQKVESLINKMKELGDSFAELSNKKNFGFEKNKKNNKANKYLELKNFEEFKTQIIKEFTNVNDNFNLLRGLTDKLSDTLNSKASFNDLKALEEDFDTKIEDLKLTLSKKFAERIETNKNFKFLDQQIKNIVQLYIKKSEKESNNWLIAKKPLNSNLCASCDAFIGDLKENSNFVPWNKYPNREGEKLYRLGNGFSKMLQLVQVDENDKKGGIINPIENSTQYNETNKDDISKNFEKGLPKIKNNFNQTKSYFYTSSNINNINPEEDENNVKKQNKKEKEDNNNQPKITKIYRINKDNA